MPSVNEPTDHRRRLLDAMSEVVARKGYGETTIADIAAEARVSKRTFYEHFAGKAECLLALYAAASEQALLVLQQSLDPTQDWHAQVERAVHAYLSTLARNAPLLRTLFIEILHMGPEGLRVRRRVTQNIADFITSVAAGRADVDAPLLARMAVAIVGGINELVLQAIENDEVDRLAELSYPSAHLVRAVIDGTLGPSSVCAPALAPPEATAKAAASPLPAHPPAPAPEPAVAPQRRKAKAA